VSRPVVVVCGLGLVGGSLARDLTRAGYRVIGVDRPAVRRQARAARAIAEGTSRLERAVEHARLVVLAAPPKANLRALRSLARLPPPRPVVTDVTSVKGPACREAARLGLGEFVGGHPMAGSSGAGFGASRLGLFRARPWALVSDAAEPRAVCAALNLVRAVGGCPVLLSADQHDRAVAFFGHLPQLVAWALLQAAEADPVASRYARLAGPGFQDMTRLAASPRGLWREILTANRRDVARALQAFRRALGRRP